MARFRDLVSGWLKSFDGDFGRFIHHEFKVEDATPHLLSKKL